MTTDENKKTIMRCIELYNRCTLEWIDTFYSHNLSWIELPKPGTPEGRHGDFAFFRKSAEQMLKIFPDCRITTLRCIAENDCVVLEQEWQGTAAATAGSFMRGRIAKMNVVSFFVLENGLITHQTDYCISAM